MHKQRSLAVWRRFSASALATMGLAFLTGCPPAVIPPGNDNTPDDLVTVTVQGQGDVTQTADGNMVTLTANPDAGWLFGNWSGATLPDANANPITVDATEIDAITANFVDDPNDPPPSPGDSDGDGIRDTVDDCPNTPPGTPVDATGCEATGADADDDGVPDSADLCANTAPGADVDSRGCAAVQRDTDNDGVNDALDDCPRTPSTVDVDARGCPVSAPGTGDADQDAVPDDIDQCPNTSPNAVVDANGCADNQRDADQDGVTDDVDQCPATAPRTSVNAVGCPTGGSPPPPPPPPGCGNGVVNAPEQCDTGGESATCNTNCTTSRCGDSIRNATAGEQCDDGNTSSGDACSSTCQTETNGVRNDSCASPTVVTDGTSFYSNVNATTDGPDEGNCNFFGESQIESDIWYCYTATCSGNVVIGLCGSEYDTKLAVYSGCGCPTQSPIACSDDDCGDGVENVQSRVVPTLTAGQQYLIRIGGFPEPPTRPPQQGGGRLTISCDTDTCTGGTGDCFSASPGQTPGCGDAACCTQTCALDQFCCDVTWDANCAGEAEGLCTGNFPACSATAGACGSAHAGRGCSDTTCCNNVCGSDPYCCLTDWDATCANEAESICYLTCNRGAGDCLAGHTSPGCNVDACCRAICDLDAYCCDTEWDASCVEAANASPSCAR